jgi:hypothetical protein
MACAGFVADLKIAAEENVLAHPQHLPGAHRAKGRPQRQNCLPVFKIQRRLIIQKAKKTVVVPKFKGISVMMNQI